MRIEYSQDAEDVRSLAIEWMKTSHAPDFGLRVELECVVGDLRTCLEQGTGTLILAYEDREPVGFAAVFAYPSFLSADRVAITKYWYAKPNAAWVGPKLYMMARRWAQASGCGHLIVSASNLASDSYDKICRFCAGAGLRKFETAWIDNLGEP